MQEKEGEREREREFAYNVALCHVIGFCHPFACNEINDDERDIFFPVWTHFCVYHQVASKGLSIEHWCPSTDDT